MKKADEPASVAALEERAGSGDARAHHALYLVYATGRGAPRDTRVAMAHLREAARLGDAQAQNDLGKAARWRLLLQLDSDSRAGMMWGNLGRLYFMIREDDLAALRFDRSFLQLQCT